MANPLTDIVPLIVVGSLLAIGLYRALRWGLQFRRNTDRL